MMPSMGVKASRDNKNSCYMLLPKCGLSELFCILSGPSRLSTVYFRFYSLV